ncbi:MAG: NADP-dependent oxidoreductase, partial [Pirellulaceae bacterium]|nr:NADP-dependent oxidoreductase [Pirellulaceae bacterium]
MTENRQVIIRELPTGRLSKDVFELRVGEVPVIGEGEALGRTILMSIDAANRAWMQGATYRQAIEPGDVMHTYSIVEVVESKNDSFSPGDIVSTEATWAEYVKVDTEKAQKLPDVKPLSHLMSVYGIAGKTAYHGLVGVGVPKAGETVVVSAAAGSVGMYVGQIAKALGCRVVGIAGGPEKCAWVKEELGFDACVDYRGDSLFKGLKAACPDGIEVYFDNVGGTVLE